MRDAKIAHDWRIASQLCLQIVRMHGDPKKTKNLKREDFDLHELIRNQSKRS
ncbi:MAG: hypothetical protein IJE77_14725 [Thermoguttaceae bacterium]|jgi:hypothetical protein|nr:hypothetical protein [Thermoguttaceae bacterium]MBQ9799133.1 hypothetical protein [Thermoguttaceae bacterium]MBR4975992.1 hypothetical protein [Thermoguttaceae bacterium]